MTEWYLPITIVPGLGLIILSTSNLLLSLSSEIKDLIVLCNEVDIIKRKLKQLKMLSMTLVFFYASVALLLIAALTTGILNMPEISLKIVVLAITLALAALVLLVNYSFNALKIRQDQFKNKLE